MKIFYNSKLAKLLTFIPGFSTMMFYGFIITEKSSLKEFEKVHEETHVNQYWDCFSLGIFISVILLFTLFSFNICNMWLLLLLLIPINLYYIIYGVEFIIKYIKYKDCDKAYSNIGFEIQASWIEETWNKPCEERNHYTSFGWWSNKLRN